MCYMRTVTHREMRNSSGEILRAVAAGESILVTNNGVVAAVISPPPGDVLHQLIADGSARVARRPLADLADIARTSSDLTTAEILTDTRGRW